MDYKKPLYIFVLATQHNHWDFDINEALKNPLPSQNEPACIKPCISGGSLAFGCWEQPKEAVGTVGGYYVLIINEEIEHGTPFKWVDVSGQYEPSCRDSSGNAWEPNPNENRVFDIGRPAPGEAGVCVCASWGDPIGRVIYFPLPMEKEVMEAMEQQHVARTEHVQRKSETSASDASDSGAEPCSPTSNGPISPGIRNGKEIAAVDAPKRELIPDGKKPNSGRRSARKRLNDSFRRVRKSIGNALTCGRGEYD
jgi:hypothetical protein